MYMNSSTRGETQTSPLQVLNLVSEHRAQNYNDHGSSVPLPESICALLLLSNSGVDDSQRVTVLSAASTANAFAAMYTAGSTS